MKPKDLSILFLLAAIWGASYLFIRIAAPVLGPAVLIDARVLMAGGVLLLYAAAIRHRPGFRSRWKRYLILGAVNAAIPFTLIATSELYLTASLAAILNATTPLFTAVVAALWLKDQLTIPKIAGIAIGLAGVAVLVGWSPLPLTGKVLLAVGLSLLAALCYGIGGVYATRAFRGTPSLTLAIGQQLAAGLLLIPFAAAQAPVARLSLAAGLALGALALLSTSVAYLLYFHLIAAVGPTKTLSVTFLIPVFGLLWGALFLGEPVGAGTLIGMAIILASITLVTGVRRATSSASIEGQRDIQKGSGSRHHDERNQGRGDSAQGEDKVFAPGTDGSAGHTER
jgi:drug/metabolite transporter (DMT)-like permease